MWFPEAVTLSPRAILLVFVVLVTALGSAPQTVTSAPASTVINLVPNSSLELPSEADENLPRDWRGEHWGDNSAVFEYRHEGHSGTRSVKVEITRYNNGDARWEFTPQVLTGRYYEFGLSYRSNIVGRVFVNVTRKDGTNRYIGLAHAGPSRRWAAYADRFFVPSDAVAISLYYAINAVGYIITDDYYLRPAEVSGFRRGLVTLTFDDGFESVYRNVLPVLQRYGFRSTLYISTALPGRSGYMTNTEVMECRRAGHEIASHGVTHADLTTLSVAEAVKELQRSKQELEVRFGPVTDFATPYGDYHRGLIALIKRFYRSHRSTDTGFNSLDRFDPYNIRAQSVGADTALQDAEGWLRIASEHRLWLVLVYHRIDTTGESTTVTPRDFERQLDALRRRGLKVVTVAQALDEILAQTSR